MVKYLNKSIDESSEVDTKIQNASTTINERIDSEVSTLNGKIGDLSDGSQTYASATGMVNAIASELDGRIDSIDSKISTVYVFKGSKATYAEIEAIADADTGDCWFCKEDAHTYTYAEDTSVTPPTGEWLDTSGQWEDNSVLKDALHAGRGYFQISNLPAEENTGNLVSPIVQWVSPDELNRPTNTGKLEQGHFYLHGNYGNDVYWLDLTDSIIRQHIDASLDATSTNAVQNAAVVEALATKQDIMQYSSASDLAGGIAVGDIFQWTGANTTYGATPILKGHFYQAVEVVGSLGYTEIDLNTAMFIGTLAEWNTLSLDTRAQFKLVYRTDDASSGSAMALDPSPIYGSMNAVTSEGIRAAIDAGGGSGGGAIINIRISASGANLTYISPNGEVVLTPTVLLGLGAGVSANVIIEGTNRYRGTILQQDETGNRFTVSVPMSNGLVPNPNPQGIGATDIMLLSFIFADNVWTYTTSYNRGSRAVTSYDAVHEILTISNS